MTYLEKTRVVAYPSANFNSESDILQYGISYPEHERAKLTVYDSIRQSLVYARILTRRPFLISDEMPIHINNYNAEKFGKHSDPQVYWCQGRNCLIE